MKVLMIVGQFYPITGGTERECQKLASRMVRRGVEVRVLTQHHAGLPDYEVIDGIPVYRRMKGWHFYEYTYMLSVLLFLLWHIRRYDVIQCFGLYLFIPPVVMVKYLFGKKTVGRVEGSGVYGDFYRIKGLGCHRLILASARRLDRIISIARHLRREIENQGFPTEAIVTIPNSVDQDFYHPHKKGAHAGGRYICFVGRLAEEKGVDCLIKAVKKTIAEIPGITLFIVGDGPMEDELRRLSERLHMQEVIRFIENGPVLPYYHASDLFVLPSLSEGLSLSLLEAMACGVPVIASNAEGNREVLDPHGETPCIPITDYRVGEYGIMVNPHDVEGLSRAMLRLLNDDELARRLTSRARIHVQEDYALDRIVDTYQSLYACLG